MPVWVKRVHYFSLLLIIFAGFAIRLIYLNRTMRFDEALTFMAYAKSQFPSVIADYSQPNNHIFHTLLVQIIYLLFGNHPMLIRLPAFIAGVLTVPVSYKVTRLFYNKQTALVVAALMAISPSVIDFSVNARGYTLVALIMLLMLWLAQRVKQRNRTSYWLLFSVLSALGFYTLPIMLYPMGIIALWLLLSIYFQNSGKHRTQLLKNFFVAIFLGAALTVILYVPPIMFTGIKEIVANQYVAPLPASEFYNELPQVWSGIYGFVTWELPVVVVWLCNVGVLVAAIAHTRMSKDKISLLWVSLLWLIPVILVQRVNPYDRVWIFLIPLYFMLAAAGFNYCFQWVFKRMPQRNFYLAGIAVVLCLGLTVQLQQSNAIHDSMRTGRADDSEAAAFYFEQTIQNGDSLYFSYPTNWTVLYYADWHHLNFLSRESADAPQNSDRPVYIYYHWQDERTRLLDAMVDVIPNKNIAYKVVHSFPSSTLEQAYLSP